MLDLTEHKSKKDRSFRRPGRNTDLPPMTAQQAKQTATELLENGLPESLEKAMDLLAVGGVMTACQMGISTRTLRRHKDLRVVDRLPHTSTVVMETFLQYSLPVPDERESLLLFALGPVGLEIAKRRCGSNSLTGYMNYSLDRLMHDIVLNEIVLRIADLALEHECRLLWVGEQEASLYQGDTQILKPDAMLRMTKGEQEHLFLLEYHNEDHSTRAADKVKLYERAYSSGIWAQVWDTDQFPRVLASFRHPVVGRGYQEGVAAKEGGHVTFYGRTLSSVLDDLGVWFNFNAGEREPIWPWASGHVDTIQADISQTDSSTG